MSLPSGAIDWSVAVTLSDHIRLIWVVAYSWLAYCTLAFVLSFIQSVSSFWCHSLFCGFDIVYHIHLIWVKAYSCLIYCTLVFVVAFIPGVSSF